MPWHRRRAADFQRITVLPNFYRACLRAGLACFTGTGPGIPSCNSPCVLHGYFAAAACSRAARQGSSSASEKLLCAIQWLHLSSQDQGSWGTSVLGAIDDESCCCTQNSSESFFLFSECQHDFPSMLEPTWRACAFGLHTRYIEGFRVAQGVVVREYVGAVLLEHILLCCLHALFIQLHWDKTEQFGGGKC